MLAAAVLGHRVSDPARVAWLRRRVRSGRRFVAALALAHPVRPGWRTWLRGDTLVCRCEEVMYDALRAAVTERHVHGPRAQARPAAPGSAPARAAPSRNWRRARRRTRRRRVR